MWEVGYLFPNFNGCTIGIWEWISNFTPHSLMGEITYPAWDLSLTMLVKGTWALVGKIQEKKLIHYGTLCEDVYRKNDTVEDPTPHIPHPTPHSTHRPNQPPPPLVSTTPPHHQHHQHHHHDSAFVGRVLANSFWKRKRLHIKFLSNSGFTPLCGIPKAWEPFQYKAAVLPV